MSCAPVITKYCPACDRAFSGTSEVAAIEALRDHFKRGQAAGDEIHIDIAELEGWNETSAGLIIKAAADLEPT